MNLLKALLFYIAAVSAAFAAPGAHGPNGEHLDAPASQASSDARPRIETFTEAFELVGHLTGDELSIVIDRYETNEPVINGQLEVEFNGMKAPARFHADHGDYAVDDKRLLEALSTPGKHALIFTLTAGQDSDLLEGTLEVKPNDAAHSHAHFSWAWLAGGVIAAVGAAGIGLAIIMRATTARRRKTLIRK
jgi:hypothetical protein